MFVAVTAEESGLLGSRSFVTRAQREHLRIVADLNTDMFLPLFPLHSVIVQGLEDVRVTRAESEQMVAALRQRNVPVTYVVFPDEGHGFSKPKNHIAFRAVTEAFLAKHLGGQSQPIDRTKDFAGSSITFETGADLIPGLTG